MPNYLQVQMKRDRTPFFLELADGTDAGALTERESREFLVGKVVDEHGRELKPRERLRRDKIKAVTRAVELEDANRDGIVLLPVKPIT